MARSDIHFAQYQKNKSVIELLQNLQEDTDIPYEWIVVVSFYAAVHLVETCIKKNGKNSKDHFQRFNNIRSIKELKPIESKYLSLENFSRQARYDCVIFNKQRVVAPLNMLKEIENHVLPLLKQIS